MMNFKKWIYSTALILYFAVPIIAQKNVFFGEGSKVLPGASNVFELSTFKNRTARIPTGKMHTYVKKSDFLTYGYKIKPPSGKLKTKIDDIEKNGDIKGDKTESIVDDIMISNGYTKMDGKYGGKKGYDGIYIKGTSRHPTEIIIIESKQFNYTKNTAYNRFEHGGVTLNPPGSTTRLPEQMSEAWVQYVAKKLRDKGKTEIADMIDYNPKLISKYVSAVDKVQGEVYFLRLGSY
jgi:hypothetical protein